MAEDTGAQIIQAWSHHREQRNDDARREFEAILKTAPSDIDALYGLGLTLRASGESGEAVKTFQKALEAVKTASTEDMDHQQAALQGLAEDTLTIAGQNPRYTMLTRMIQQRLVELGAPAASEA